MNILYLCDEYPPGKHGGIGTSVQLLARQMVKDGHRVIVAGFYDWGYGGEDEFMDEGVHVFRYRRKLASRFFYDATSFRVKLVNKLLKVSGIFDWDIKRSLKKYHVHLEELIAKYKIDIVEMPDYNDYMRFCNTYVPFPKLSVPTVMKLHGSMTYFAKEMGSAVPEHIRLMERDLIHQVNGVSAVSKYVANKTASYLQYNDAMDIIYNGIDTDIQIGAVHKDGKQVIFTGSLTPKKGIYELLSAWNIVHEQMPGAKLDIYGKGPVKQLHKQLNGNAISSVRFLGHVSRKELFNALAKAQVAVFPSYSESFGLAPLEAMSCGTATIYTKRPPGPEIIEDGVDGILINPNDVQGIATQILYLLKNTDRCKELAIKGRETVKKCFDISVIADVNIDFYKNTNNDTH